MASSDYLFMFLSTLKELETKKGTTYGLSIVAKILSGSTAKDMVKFKHLDTYQMGQEMTQSWWISFGRNTLLVPQVLDINLVELGGGKCVKTYKVGPLGDKYLTDKIPLDITLPEYKAKKPTHKKGESAEQSYKLFLQGQNISQICSQRNLSHNTVFNHIFSQVDSDKIDRQRFVSDEKFQQIKKAWQEIGGDKLKPIKESLGDDYSYQEIRWSKLFI